MLRDVRDRGLAARLAKEGEMTRARIAFCIAIALLGIFLTVVPTARAAAEKLTLPPEITQAMETMNDGDPDGAIQIARDFEQAHPENPLGYLLENEARWWKIYCGACEIKFGMVNPAKGNKRREDEAYFAIADKAIRLAEAQIAQSETAELHLYAGIAWALKAQLYGLRGENRNTAHAGVAARTEFIRTLELDPRMADAQVGLGLYNYYVDTLSSFVKFLRFFMGIPGGNKAEGIRQLETGMKDGVLMAAEARFYLAKNLRTYDQQYEKALAIAEPLVAKYPHNPVFLLLFGNLDVELGRNGKASEYFSAAAGLSIPDPACAARVREIANTFLASLY
jgi:tetratricopeptide (TPR) repeat protein